MLWWLGTSVPQQITHRVCRSPLPVHSGHRRLAERSGPSGRPRWLGPVDVRMPSAFATGTQSSRGSPVGRTVRAAINGTSQGPPMSEGERAGYRQAASRRPAPNSGDTECEHTAASARTEVQSMGVPRQAGSNRPVIRPKGRHRGCGPEGRGGSPQAGTGSRPPIEPIPDAPGWSAGCDRGPQAGLVAQGIRAAVYGTACRGSIPLRATPKKEDAGVGVEGSPRVPSQLPARVDGEASC